MASQVIKAKSNEWNGYRNDPTEFVYVLPQYILQGLSWTGRKG